jgi:UDP-N-acetylglucosamine enolpyruvyl transferase
MAELEPGGDGATNGPQSTAYVIEGGVPLRGTVPISGAKNAVLKLMAAAVLCDEPCTISNAPRIADVEYILEVLCDLGAEAGWVGEHELRIHAAQLEWDFIPLEAAKRLRASFVLLGPMLGRLGKVVIPNPADARSTSTSRPCAHWAPRSTTSGATTTPASPAACAGRICGWPKRA